MYFYLHTIETRIGYVGNCRFLLAAFYCIQSITIEFFKSFLKRPVILDAVWGFPELHHLVKKGESIVELFYTTFRRGGGGGCTNKLLNGEAPVRGQTSSPSLYHFDRKGGPFVYCNFY